MFRYDVHAKYQTDRVDIYYIYIFEFTKTQDHKIEKNNYFKCFKILSILNSYLLSHFIDGIYIFFSFPAHKSFGYAEKKPEIT